MKDLFKNNWGKLAFVLSFGGLFLIASYADVDRDVAPVIIATPQYAPYQFHVHTLQVDTLTAAGLDDVIVARNPSTRKLTSYSRTKIPVPYSGTSNASGNYTVVFATAYSAAPNIQANVVGGNTEQQCRIVSVSTTGFTINAFQRTTVLSLALSTATTPVIGAAIDVLVTEK